jgi:sulfatase modifying factor 1
VKLTRLATLCLLLAAGPLLRAEETFSLDLGNGLKLELVLIKAGTFTQGSPASEAGRGNDENQREVTLTEDYYIGKYPITKEQFARFVAETRYQTEAEKGASGGFGWNGKELIQRKDFTWKNTGFTQSDDHPVTLVTYDDALAFTKWLARKTGRAVNLPTEAQWEYACRAGTITRFYSGDADSDAAAIAWLKTNSGDGTRTVSGRNPNAWGLYDMSGNVYEWVRDWYSPTYAPGPVNNPEETRNNMSDKPRRVLRGGSWLKDAKGCRSAARWRNTPGSRNADNGFRIIASVAAGIVAPPVPAQTPVQPTQPQQSPINLESPHPVVPPIQPQPSPNQYSAPSHVSSGVGFFGVLGILLIFGFGAAIIAFIIYKIVSSSSPSRRQFNNVQPRAVSDGFYLNGQNLSSGSVVRYRYMKGGRYEEGTYTVIDPGPNGMFIYTGSRPDDIEILDVVSGVAAASSYSTPQPVRTQTRSSSSYDDSPRYPSAY